MVNIDSNCHNCCHVHSGLSFMHQLSMTTFLLKFVTMDSIPNFALIISFNKFSIIHDNICKFYSYEVSLGMLPRWHSLQCFLMSSYRRVFANSLGRIQSTSFINIGFCPCLAFSHPILLNSQPHIALFHPSYNPHELGCHEHQSVCKGPQLAKFNTSNPCFLSSLPLLVFTDYI